MWAAFALAIAVYLLFAVVPTLGNVALSLTGYTGLPGTPIDFVGFHNYVQLVTTQLPGFKNSLIVTAIFVAGVTIFQNMIGMMLAHRLRAETRHAALLRVLVFLPIVLGVTVVGLIWLLLMDPLAGPVPNLLAQLGVHSAFFGSSNLALPLVIIVQIWQNLGFTMVVFIGGLNAIPQEIYDAASVDGVGAWRRFVNITFPLMAPSVTANVLLAVVGSFTTYNLIYVLTAGQFNTDTLGMLSFNAAFGLTADVGYGATVSVVLFVLTLIIALPLLGWLRHRERALFA
jgi:raffinose/stachyose/melibiose transport system permease protein